MSDEYRAKILRSQARDALAAAQARCCSHGVEPDHCKLGHGKPETTDETEGDS